MELYAMRCKDTTRAIILSPVDQDRWGDYLSDSVVTASNYVAWQESRDRFSQGGDEKFWDNGRMMGLPVWVSLKNNPRLPEHLLNLGMRLHVLSVGNCCFAIPASLRHQQSTSFSVDREYPLPSDSLRRQLALPDPPFPLPPIESHGNAYEKHGEAYIHLESQLFDYTMPFDFLNPIAVVSVVHGDTALGRLRRAHLMGPFRDDISNLHVLDHAKSQGVFASQAQDPEGCRMFARSWNGLWYLIDGKTGRFHDVIVPDTARGRRYAAPGSLVFTPLAAIFWGVALFVFFALSLVGLRSFPVPILLLGGAAGAILSFMLVGVVNASAVPDERGARDSYGSAPEWNYVSPTDTTRSCRDTSSVLLLPLSNVRNGVVRVRHGTTILGTFPLAPVAGPRGVAWDAESCEGFVEVAPKSYVHVDGTTGRFRRAIIRQRAHFFSWPDTLPEVRQWWESDPLLPPGREPDLVVLPAPFRVEVPIAVQNYLMSFWIWVFLCEVIIYALALPWWCIVKVRRRFLDFRSSKE